MNSKLVTMFAALVGLGALGWYAYTQQRQPLGTAVEVKGPGAPPAPSAQGGAGPGTGGPPRAGAPGAAAPGGAPAGGGPAGGGPRGPTGVEVARVSRMALAEEATAVGTLRANESVTLRSEVSGRIQRVNFSDGARVGRGAVLVALDASVTAAEVEQARAERALAVANFDRTAELAERNFVSQSAKDQASANLKVQDAKLRLAEARLAKSDIRAPFSGVMGLRNVSPGDFVKDGTDLAVLEDISSMKVDLRMPERYFGRLQRGMLIQVSFDSLPGKTFTATLDALDVQVDANGRSLLARGRLANPDGALRTGMFARARVLLRENPNALVVPEESLSPQGNDVFVWRVDGGKAVRTKVQTGLRREGKVEIVQGLSVGDAVVTAGQLRLQRDGQEVRVIDPSRPPGGPGGPGAAGAGPAAGAAAAGTTPAGAPPAGAPPTGTTPAAVNAPGAPSSGAASGGAPPSAPGAGR
jgi:membrane fusion protein (multidrug efflux system)